ncbi:DUF4410 domain-containing protein [Candidatus Tisiphia endosymbiont of Ditula angustiorana]|uniref:DUF4410 domain-containing protein n=1 Tax=Candidatus Tisiphia endosymbiont of Ditula angustiorana TaxID=3066272 RepID=UPI00312CB7E0
MKNIIFLILTIMLSSCGSTSSIRNAQPSESRVDFSSYDYIIINDFEDGTSKSSDDPHVISEGKRFADMIASSIKSKKLFDKVQRNVDSTDRAILIDGKITKYSEGNAVMRTLIGFGAGSSRFDAKINIKDNETKKLLGILLVNEELVDEDQNQQVLGVSKPRSTAYIST